MWNGDPFRCKPPCAVRRTTALVSLGTNSTALPHSPETTTLLRKAPHVLTTCNHAPPGDRIQYELATKGAIRVVVNLRELAAELVSRFAATIQRLEPLPPETEAHARRGSAYAELRGMLEARLRVLVSQARGDALEEFTASELERPPPAPVLEAARAEAFVKNWSVWSRIGEDPAAFMGIEDACFEDLVAEFIAARQRGRDELAPLLRRAVGVVSDLGRLSGEVAAVLDAFAAHPPPPAPPIDAVAAKVLSEG